MNLIDIQELAAALRCSTKTIRRKVESGVIPAIQLGAKGSLLRFDLATVLESLQAHSQPESYGASDSTESGDQKHERLSGPLPKWQKPLNKQKGRRK